MGLGSLAIRFLPADLAAQCLYVQLASIVLCAHLIQDLLFCAAFVTLRNETLKPGLGFAEVIVQLTHARGELLAGYPNLNGPKTRVT